MGLEMNTENLHIAHLQALSFGVLIRKHNIYIVETFISIIFLKIFAFN